MQMAEMSHLRSLGGFNHAKSCPFHDGIYLEPATSASKCKLCPATWESRERGLCLPRPESPVPGPAPGLANSGLSGFYDHRHPLGCCQQRA